MVPVDGSKSTDDRHEEESAGMPWTYKCQEQQPNAVFGENVAAFVPN